MNTKKLKTLLLSCIGVFAIFLMGVGGRSLVDIIYVNQYLDMNSSATPAVPATNTMRIYNDSTSGTPYISTGGTNPFVPLIAQPKYNYIMNPDGLIWQRRTSATTTDTYGFDRWKVCHNMSGTNFLVSQALSRDARLKTKALTTNSVTLGHDAANSFLVGEHVTVACNPADAIFDGTQTITAQQFATGTLVYPITHANVGSTASNGTFTEQGLTGVSYMTHEALNTGKFLLYQVIDAKQATYLRGRTVVVQFKTKYTPSTGNIRSTIIQWGGTTGSVTQENAQWPATLVTTWGSNGTDPTFTTISGNYNFAKVSPGNNISASGGSIVSSAFQVANTVDWTQYAYTITIPSDFQQIALAFWSDSAFSNTNLFCLTEVGLYDALEIQPYNPRNEQQELAMCQRYYQKSFSQTTTPASNVGANTGETQFITRVTVGNTDQTTIALPVVMRTTPTITLYNPVAANNHIRNYTASSDWYAENVAFFSSDRVLGIAGTNPGTTLQLSGVHWTADADY